MHRLNDLKKRFIAPHSSLTSKGAELERREKFSNKTVTRTIQLHVPAKPLIIHIGHGSYSGSKISIYFSIKTSTCSDHKITALIQIIHQK